MRLLNVHRLMVVVPVLAIAASACSSGGSPVAGPSDPQSSKTPASVSPRPTAGDCPSVKGSGYAAIDYVDFVHYQGRDYISGLNPNARGALPASELGAVLFTVRCSLSRLNDATGKEPAEERDGDAAFLDAGTPVYSVRGWSSGCRIAARASGQWRIFLAYRNGGHRAEPLPCALHH